MNQRFQNRQCSARGPIAQWLTEQGHRPRGARDLLDGQALQAPGEEAVAIAQELADAFAAKHRAQYPLAVDCLLTNLSALTTHLHFPVEHRERVRHTNLLERTFGESRRRVKVIGRLPGENSCLSLVWAVLDRASVGWRGIDTSVAGIRRLQDLRRQLLGEPELRATG